MSTERQQLIASCQGLVRSLAWKIHCKLPPHVDLEDLISYGQVGLAEAARDFDLSRSNQFSTFAYYRIRGAILDGLSKMAWFKKIDYESGRYEQLANDVLNTGAADPSANTTSVEDEVRWLKGVAGPLAVVHLCCGRAGSERAEIDLEDSSMPPPADEMLRQEFRERLHALIAALPEDSAKLIRGAYFEGLTLTEAAARIGISKAWASRLHAKVLGQLARSLALAGDSD